MTIIIKRVAISILLLFIVIWGIRSIQRTFLIWKHIRQFTHHKKYENKLISVPIMTGFYPAKGNEALFSKKFGKDEISQLAANMISTQSDGWYLDPVTMDKQVYYSAYKSQKDTCENFPGILFVDQKTFPKAERGIVKNGTIEWHWTYYLESGQITYFHCNNGVLFQFTYYNRKSSSKDEMLRFSQKNIRQVVFAPNDSQKNQ